LREAARAALANLRAEIRLVAGRGQHHRRAALAGELLRHLEPVEIRQLDVEQHHVGLELTRRGKRRPAVLRLADDVEALGLEQPPGNAAEPVVVVHDQDAGHVRIVADPSTGRGTGSHTLCRGRTTEESLSGGSPPGWAN